MQFDMRPILDSEISHGCHVRLEVIGRNSKQIFTTEMAQECRKQLDRMVVTSMIINPSKCIHVPGGASGGPGGPGMSERARKGLGGAPGVAKGTPGGPGMPEQAQGKL